MRFFTPLLLPQKESRILVVFVILLQKLFWENNSKFAGQKKFFLMENQKWQKKMVLKMIYSYGNCCRNLMVGRSVKGNLHNSTPEGGGGVTTATLFDFNSVNWKNGGQNMIIYAETKKKSIFGENYNLYRENKN